MHERDDRNASIDSPQHNSQDDHEYPPSCCESVIEFLDEYCCYYIHLRSFFYDPMRNMRSYLSSNADIHSSNGNSNSTGNMKRATSPSKTSIRNYFDDDNIWDDSFSAKDPSHSTKKTIPTEIYDDKSVGINSVELTSKYKIMNGND